MKKKQKNTIRSRILNGYFRVIVIIVILVIGSLCLLSIVENGYKSVNNYRDQQCTA